MTKDQVAQSSERWDKAADFYERTAEPFTKQYSEAALRALPSLQGRRVLEVAAGTGVFAVAAAQVGGQVLATDFSQAMVTKLQAKLRPFQGAEARVMDGEALALADAQFDVAVSMFGVMMFANYEQGLRELVRVVRPGGRVLLGVWESPYGAGPNLLLKGLLEQAFPEVSVPAPPPGMLALQTPAGIKTALEAAGCRTVEVRRCEGAWTAPSVDQAMALMDELLDLCPVPLYGCLEGELRARLLTDLRQVLADSTRADGTVAVPAAAHLGVGFC